MKLPTCKLSVARGFTAFLKNKKLVKVFILTLCVSFFLATAGSLTYALVQKNRLIDDKDGQINDLYLETQQLSNELETLQKNLSKTEEGKKQLEQAKAEVEEQNKVLGEKADEAEKSAEVAKADLSKAQTNLSKAQGDLRTKEAELSRINAELSSKQAELDKAKRGIAIFEQTEPLFEQFTISMSNCQIYLSKIFESIVNDDESGADYYMDLYLAEIVNSENLYNQIRSKLDLIKSGNY